MERVAMIHCFPRPSSVIAVIFMLCWQMFASASAAEPVRVVVLGDSITSGFGLEKNEAYPALVEKLARADGHELQVVNAGLSGDTTRGGLRRIKVLVRKPMDVLVIALGGNDGLRGIEPEVTRANLAAIIEQARKACPKVRILLAGMQMPDNMGEEYTRAFKKIFPTVAKEKQVAYLPFLLEGVATVKELNLADGIHPNRSGHRILAKHVYRFLREVLAAE